MENKKEEKEYIDARFDVIEECSNAITEVLNKQLDKYGTTLEEQFIILGVLSAQIIKFGCDNSPLTRQSIKKDLLRTVSVMIDKALEITDRADTTKN